MANITMPMANISTTMPGKYPADCLGSSMNLQSLFRGKNPLEYSLPILMLQTTFASMMACFTSALFMPLGFPPMITQILAGILLGPNLLGHLNVFGRHIFPERVHINMITYGGLGSIIQIFLIGVRIDPKLLMKPGKNAVIIGISVIVIPLTLVSIFAFIVWKTIALDNNAFKSLVVVGILESMNSFPVIAGYLIELNILNTEFSKVAFCSSMVSTILCSAVLGAILIHRQQRDYTIVSVGSMVLSFAFVLVIIGYVIRPIIRWMTRRIPDGQAMRQGDLNVVFALTLLSALISEQVSAETLFGPFVIGLIIPSGPPLGSVLIEKYEFFNKWLAMPIFYTMHGSMIDNCEDATKQNLLVLLVVLIAFIGKFLGAFLPALYFNMSYNDSSLLGLTMTAQGFIEILTFTMLREIEYIDHGAYNIMYVSILILTGASAPLLRCMYKASMKYKLYNKRTIQHLKPNAELRILGCVYEEDNVPSIIHLLKATNPSKETPVYFSIVHFVELVGRSTPIFISHRRHRKLPAATAVSERIINVFQHYEENNIGAVSIQPYTVVSNYASLHTDVCMLALHKRTSLIVLPYHKNIVTGDTNMGVKTVNCEVLEKSPCSVAILIDRGLLGGIRFVFTNWESYHVAVIFLGGADDREALAHGMRMSENPTIELSVFRFLTTAKEKDSDPTERNLDEAMINNFKFETSYNNQVKYKEMEVKKTVGVIQVFDSMADKYELIILGRRHDKRLQLIIELTDWDKCSELGTIGDIFTTSGYGGKATLLVVQQQSKVAALSQTCHDEAQSLASYDVERPVKKVMFHLERKVPS